MTIEGGVTLILHFSFKKICSKKNIADYNHVSTPLSLRQKGGCIFIKHLKHYKVTKNINASLFKD